MRTLLRRSFTTGIEPLESRIAPATLVNPTTVTFQDVDGDLVTVKSSKPIFVDATINNVFTFAGGSGVDGLNGIAQQLQAIDLTQLGTPADATKTNITISAQRSSITGGDGFVNVGAILASGIDLGTVTVKGDLGRIVSGNLADGGVGLKGLNVRSMGEFETDTQDVGGDLNSVVNGAITTISVGGNIRGAYILSTGNGAFISKATVGGSIIGLDSTDFSGRIGSDGDIGTILVKGSLIGADAADSGTLDADGVIKSVTVLGSVIGGEGDDSAQIDGDGGINKVTIGGDLVGGDGIESGVVNGGVYLGTVKIGGSMRGGGGEESGSLLASSFAGVINSVSVGGDIKGGAGEESAYIHAGTELGPVTVKGSVFGGAGQLSASIYAGGAISSGNIMKAVTINGDLQGGTGVASANIGAAFGALGGVASVNIGKVIIKGSIIGLGNESAAITANDIGLITVGRSMEGSGVDSAQVQISGVLSKMTVGGSLTGGAGVGSGRISAGVSIGALKIAGDVSGGDGNFSGEIFANLSGAKSIIIGGSLTSGTGTSAGGIHINGPTGSILIGGSVNGTATDPVVISARGNDGEVSPMALKSLTIKGSATYLNVLGGWLNISSTPFNSDANIGSIVVGGDWIAGSIVAGVDDGTDLKFGTADDVASSFGNDGDNVSRIASILIKGQVIGTVGGTDHFGFVAEQIGKLKIGATTYTFTSAEDDPIALGSTGDFIVREDVTLTV